MTNPLVGVWEKEYPRNGLTIYTETHQVHINVEKDRAERFKNVTELTEADELAAFRSMGAGALTYAISGNEITFTWLYHSNPNSAGKTVTTEFTIEGDKLTITGPPNGKIYTVERKIA